MVRVTQSANRSVHLVVIDPQNDFCDPEGSLFVPGADEDIRRLSRMVERLRDRLTDVHVTLDSHRKVDISHAIWWRDGRGRHPDPFTVISAADLRAGNWSTSQPSAFDRSLAYLEALERGGRYPHVVWPYHCLIGDAGHNIHPVLADAIHDWEDRFAMADMITKGSNPWTEHFSGVQAEVPDPADPSTQVNTSLVETLEHADLILMAGQALSHCLANTVRDISSHFSDPKYVAKIHLLRDATGNVPGFERYGEEFLREMSARGMRITTTTDVLAA
jgi:nicotinamidase-related amidase